MLRFAKPPQGEFKEILENSFLFLFDGTFCVNAEEKVDLYLGDTNAIYQFGSCRNIMNQYLELYAAHNSKQIFQITDWHWFLIYHMLETYIEIHNCDYSALQFPEEVDLEANLADDILYDRERTRTHWMNRELNLQDYIDAFFWDEEFLLDISKYAFQLDNPIERMLIMDKFGMDESTINFITNQRYTSKDLEIVLCED